MFYLGPNSLASVVLHLKMFSVVMQRVSFYGKLVRPLFCFVLIANFMLAGSTAEGQEKKGDPEFLSVAFGAFDFNRQKDQGAEFRLEYRSDKKLLNIFKPFGAGAYSLSGHGFLGGGLLLDLYFGRRYVVTPSLAPHLYFGGDSDLDLDFPLQFRSQLEVAYRLDNRERIGLALSHYSNASLGDDNPGTESIMLYYSLPLDLNLGR